MFVLALTFAAAALGGGLIAGTWVGMRPQAVIGVAQSFLIWLGLVGVVFTTFAKSMEALPFALIFATVIGIVPFTLGYFSLKALLAKIRERQGLSKS